MPSAFQIFPDDNFVVTLHWGRIDARGHAAMIREYRAHPDARPEQNCLVDFSRVEDFDVTFQSLLYEISSLQLPNVNPALSRTAILAPDGVAFGIARMYLSVIEGRLSTQAIVATTRDEAFAFLGMADAERFHIQPPLP